MKTWEYFSRPQYKADNLRAFLYRVANNLIIDESRKKKSVSLEDLQEQGFDPSDNAKDKLLSFMEGGDMIKLVNSIDAKYRQAITMRYVDDLSPKEIAEAIGETENNVSVRIHRGLEQVRNILKENE